MLIKWTDLEVGDVLRFNNTIYEFYKNTNGDWCDKWCNKDLTINYIDISNGIINIGFRCSYEKDFRINESGHGIGWQNSGIQLFEIVSLKE